MATKKTTPAKPEIVDKKSIQTLDIPLKVGQCLVEQLEGSEKGLIFKTSISTAEQFYSDEKKFKIIKKK